MSVTADNEVLAKVAELTELALGTYRYNPARIEEDANGERRIHQGGYGDRQLFELVQNASDELRDPEHQGGRIHVILTEDTLYCANEGTPITPEGADTILRMGVSKKRGGQIGRFGVGIKSVLSVTRTPQFFSKTGSFGFDAEWAAEQILSAVNEGRQERRQSPISRIDEVPVLRVAKRLDVERECAGDPDLTRLLRWASTVVRLPLVDGAAAELSLDIHHRRSTGESVNREFPHLFQLFSPHVGSVILEDRSASPGVRRELLVKSRGGVTTIFEARGTGEKSKFEDFHVFTRPHQVSDASRSGAGELHDRVTIDVSWAVPDFTRAEGARYLTVPNDRGTFWSFFPTKYSTTLSGALNAAWKTNEDRQNLLDSSDLNWELLRVSAALIVDSLKELAHLDDPAAYLPLLPGRSKESPNWACKYLTEQVWALAAKKPSLPDQDGVLCEPGRLRIHREKLSDEALALWRAYDGRPSNWVHHSVEGPGSRRGKVNHILEAANHRGQESIKDWLEALVEDGTVEASAAAIKVLAHLIENDLDGERFRAEASQARQARIVLTEEYGFVAAEKGALFRRSNDDGLLDGMICVASRLAEDNDLLHAFEVLGIPEADAEGRFLGVVDRGFEGYTAESWQRFWELLREAGGAARLSDLRNRIGDPATKLWVRTAAGTFSPFKKCFLPGPVVASDTTLDRMLVVDMEFHADDQQVFESLGAVDRPVLRHRPDNDAWYVSYEDAVYKEYCAELGPTDKRVQLKTMKLDGSSMAGPLQLFVELSPVGRAAFLAAMPEDGLVQNWTRQIGRNAATRTQIVSPIRWLLHNSGYVETSQGLKRVSDAVGPQLSQFRDVLPVAQISSSKALSLRLPRQVEDVPAEAWEGLLERIKDSTDDQEVGRGYAILIRVAEDLINQEVAVRCRVGHSWKMLPDSDIAVALDKQEYEELIRENHPALLVESEDHEQAQIMIELWGMKRVSDVIEKSVRVVPSGNAVALIDEYPPLRQRFGSRVRGLLIQRCAELEEVVRTPNGTRLRALPSAIVESTVHIPVDTSFEDALVLADHEFGLGLGTDSCKHVIAVHRQHLENKEARSRITYVRDAESVTEKLAAMLDEAQLRRGLPAGLVENDRHERGRIPDVQRLAELAYHAHYDGVLRVYAKELSASFPETPHRFDGGTSALKFVTDLGFPDGFAGVRTPSPPEREEAQGPTEFPELHPYQDEIASGLVEMLCAPTPQRAMLSLPTGAGKTRVAAEGVIRWIRKSGVPDGPILWIAQTAELCEQAVQSWKFVWEKVGASQPLVIDRLWGGNSSTPVTGRPHLVVATDAKLAEHLHTDGYAWLRNAALVIVDEAHVGISKEYTGILEHLGLTHRVTSRHLIGLTATPFRNDAELTRRLVQRFGDRRLDDGVFAGEPIACLQDMKILSAVEHRELEGKDMKLHEEELVEVQRLNGFLPKSAERRLAEDETRNKLLVDEIVSLPDDWPVLVFATSVDHAKLLAAQLSGRGVRSVAIDSATPAAERRRSIEKFRSRDIRVITNYGVLSQGFDAPATRVVVIARPVYSSNIYQQMVGRGLRGPKNGGKDTCLILDVKDNITNFDKHLAFTEFEHLWKKDAR